MNDNERLIDHRRRDTRTTRTRLRAAVGAVAVLSGALLASPSAAEPASTGHDAPLAGAPLIVYQQFPYVRVQTLDGTDDRVVTTVPEGSQEHPDWSPDGRTLVMDVDFAALWTVSVDGTDPREVYRCAGRCVFIQDGAWSPDGTEIAFLRYSARRDGVRARPSEIVGLDVETLATRVIYREADARDIPFGPRWSPNGHRIVFEENRFVDDRTDATEIVGARLVSVRADGSGGRRELTRLRSGASGVDWGATGRIVTSRNGNLFTMDAVGGDRRRITDLDNVSEYAIQPTFTPSGQGISFTFVRGEFGVDDEPTLGLVSGYSGDVVVRPAGGPRITHPRVQPVPCSERAGGSHRGMLTGLAL